MIAGFAPLSVAGRLVCEMSKLVPWVVCEMNAFSVDVLGLTRPFSRVYNTMKVTCEFFGQSPPTRSIAFS